MTLVHATVAPTAQLEIPWRPDFNALVYVLAGSGTVGPRQQPIRAGQSAVFGPGDTIAVSADQTQESRAPSLEVIVLGGRPIRESIAWAGPFVMNTRAEVIEAFEDFQAGRLGRIPSVHGLDGTIRTAAN
jgi:redox-sensitive bicupin YhaK (pirin superfamily)